MCVYVPQAVKNLAELTGMREAHLRDAVAICDFFAWFEATIASGRELSEVRCALCGGAFWARGSAAGLRPLHGRLDLCHRSWHALRVGLGMCMAA